MHPDLARHGRGAALLRAGQDDPHARERGCDAIAVGALLLVQHT
jgi:hypothetical protein